MRGCLGQMWHTPRTKDLLILLCIREWLSSLPRTLAGKEGAPAGLQLGSVWLVGVSFMQTPGEAHAACAWG